ncbi:hypothetical protein E2C01_003881 [Portunus trituberculatus]|uniref:Uncharacterized protein n=1 Tax=Portunus trituberculatus TaxID=210409 RepID=A0A5B7CQY3_PORTR|nr:hypothetical protein [Portunus trituberculatus]
MDGWHRREWMVTSCRTLLINPPATHLFDSHIPASFAALRLVHCRKAALAQLLPNIKVLQGVVGVRRGQLVVEPHRPRAPACPLEISSVCHERRVRESEQREVEQCALGSVLSNTSVRSLSRTPQRPLLG